MAISLRTLRGVPAPQLVLEGSGRGCPGLPAGSSQGAGAEEGGWEPFVGRLRVSPQTQPPPLWCSGVRSVLGAASAALTRELRVGVRGEGERMSGGPWPQLSSLTHRSVISAWLRVSVGEPNSFIVRIFLFPPPFFFPFPINTCQGFKAKSLAKARVSAPAQAKDGSKEGTERGIVPTLQSGESRSGKKMQVWQNWELNLSPQSLLA